MSLAARSGPALAVVCLILLCALLALVNQRDAARRDAAMWQAGAQARLAELKELEADREALSAALARRETDIRAAARQRADRRRTLKEAAAHDQTVENWSRVRLPDAVRGLLR